MDGLVVVVGRRYEETTTIFGFVTNKNNSRKQISRTSDTRMTRREAFLMRAMSLCMIIMKLKCKIEAEKESSCYPSCQIFNVIEKEERKRGAVYLIFSQTM